MVAEFQDRGYKVNRFKGNNAESTKIGPIFTYYIHKLFIIAIIAFQNIDLTKNLSIFVSLNSTTDIAIAVADRPTTSVKSSVEPIWY